MLPVDGRVPQNQLRRELERVTTELTYERIGEQAAAIEELREKHSHSLELVVHAVVGQPETFRFTCFQYAFRLTDPPDEIIQICTKFPNIFPSSEFVRFLIARYLTEVQPGHEATGDLVVYFAVDNPIHAAVVDGDKLISKWGLAHLWRHGLSEVPEKYGERLRVFKPLTRDEAIGAFIHFAARELGLST